MKYFPENTVTRYTTHLQSMVKLSGEWEVALTEISFPRNWMTIPIGKKMIIMGSVKDDYNVGDYMLHVPIPAGYYSSVIDLIDTLNSSIGNEIYQNPIAERAIKPDHRPRFLYHPRENRAEIYMHPFTDVFIDKHLANILGFESRRDDKVTSYCDIANHASDAMLLKGARGCDLNAGIHSAIRLLRHSRKHYSR